MRRTKKRDAWFYLVPVAVLIAVFVFSSIHALRIYLPQRREQSNFARLREEIEIPSEDPEESVSFFVNRYESVMAKNGDFACWLKIPDSVVDYPVMKSSEDDPEYYLRRGFDKKYSSAGCLFIGGGCNLDSDSFIIYGHNMDADTMFGELDLYYDSDYALKHRLIRIGTPTEDRIYRVYAAFQTRIYDANAENQCAPDYVTDTGIFGIKLLPSAVALVSTGIGIFLVCRKIRKKYSVYAESLQ